MVILAALAATGLVNDTVVVVTQQGAVRGREENGVAVFRGIPYAEPPVGELRWKSPLAASGWSGVRPAIADGPGCPQQCRMPVITCPPVQSEDCLTLQVFSPNITGIHAVMVFIHGGNFYQGYGGGLLYDGSKYARDHGVVVVSINYRLGALGFLYSGDNASHEFVGNFGLHDQRVMHRNTPCTPEYTCIIS